MSDKSYFARWCIDLRTQTGLSIEKFCKRIGVSPTDWRAYEQERYMCRSERLTLIADALKIDYPQDVHDWIEEQRRNYCRPQKKGTVLTHWLRARRLDLKYTQQQCSQAVGCGATYWGRIENGRRLPSFKKMEEIEKLLGKMPDEVSKWYCQAALESQFATGNELPTEDISPFGRMLRKERRARGLSCQALSEMLGKSDWFVDRLEKGSHGVSVAVMSKLSEIFGYSGIPSEWFDLREQSDQVFLRQDLEDDLLPPLGKELRALRRKKFDVLSEFADAIGRTTPFVLQVEHGSKAISDKDLLGIAIGLGFSAVPPHWYELRKISGMVPQGNSGDLNCCLSHFGLLTRVRRKELNITIDEVSRALSKNDSYFHEVEYGRKRLSKEELLIVSKLLGYKEIPVAFEEALEKDRRGLQVPRGMREKDMSEQGWKVRKQRLDQGKTLQDVADEKNVKPWRVRVYDEDLPVMTWKEKRKKGLVK